MTRLIHTIWVEVRFGIKCHKNFFFYFFHTIPSIKSVQFSHASHRITADWRRLFCLENYRNRHTVSTHRLARLQSLHLREQACVRCVIRIPRAKQVERAEELLVHVHHRARIVQNSAVIWCREHRHQALAGEEPIAVLAHLDQWFMYHQRLLYLMSPDNQVKIETLANRGDHVLAKGERRASIGRLPTLDRALGIGP